MNLPSGMQVVATVAWDNKPQSPPVWASDSPSVAILTAADGLSATIAYVSPGNSNITATATNPDGTTAVATGQVVTGNPILNTTSGIMTFGTPTPIAGPVPGALLASYADVNAFADAVAAYTGPEDVTLDGVEVKAGTLPALAYVSNLSDATINLAPAMRKR